MSSEIRSPFSVGWDLLPHLLPGALGNALELCPLQVEQGELQNLFEKYVPYLIDVIVEGIVDGRQGEKLKMIVPQTSLNMVRTSPRGGNQHCRP